MYANLMLELLRKKISRGELANALGLCRNTLNNKLTGKSRFHIEEAFTIRDIYFPQTDLEYLFHWDP